MVFIEQSLTSPGSTKQRIFGWHLADIDIVICVMVEPLCKRPPLPWPWCSPWLKIKPYKADPDPDLQPDWDRNIYEETLSDLHPDLWREFYEDNIPVPDPWYRPFNWGVIPLNILAICPLCIAYCKKKLNYVGWKASLLSLKLLQRMHFRPTSRSSLILNRLEENIKM